MRNHFLLFAAVLMSVAPALTVAEPCALNLVFPAASTTAASVEADVHLENGVLVGHFEVAAKTIYSKATLGPNEYPYMFDVVEMFVSVTPGGLPYYEMELSPLGQTFQVKILNPKLPFINNVNLGEQVSVATEPGGWRGEIRVPLAGLKWDGDPAKITGNLYAILGQNPNRTYFSAFMPKLPHANFHQPQYFKPLLSCSPVAAGKP